MARNRQSTLEHYRRRYAKLTEQLTSLGFISSGSVVQRSTYCGNPRCRCMGDPARPHGPYHQWTRKVAGKTVTKRLTAEEARLYKQWIADRRKLDKIVADMQSLSTKAAPLVLDEQATE